MEVARKSDFSHAREQRAEKHGGGNCLVPAIIIIGSVGLWAGAIGYAVWIFA